ncbi:MAG: class I SAM-dependent methyltransferase [Steroidobacteraceae bacterium]
MITYTFFHGLGDCANAAHLFSLYTRRGHRIGVQCAPDKAPLFQAAGCELVARAARTHPWEHPPAAGAPNHEDHWSGNKTAWNISRYPLPNIGRCAERWEELCAAKLNLDQFVTREMQAEVDRYIETLPRPVVLFAPQGNTGTEGKNLSHEVQSQTLHGLLDSTGGAVILLDWDQRVFKLPNWRVRHLGDDWRPLSTVELYALIKRADLVIGCDSGVLHFTRFTDTPALGAWTRHHPSQFALPRRNTLHLVPASQNELSRYRRIAYNIVECAGEKLSGSFVAEQAVRMLCARKYLSDAVPDTLLRHLLDNCRQFESPMTSFVDRHRTFGAFLDIARRMATPTIVETGTIRAAEDWSAGFSTYLIGFFLQQHGGGELHSVDLDAKNVAFARAWTRAFGDRVRIHQEHSHAWLSAYAGRPIDLLYLDSADVGTQAYQECSLREVQLALPHLAAEAVILFDDTCWRAGEFQGKGKLAVPWLLQHGWKIVAGGYQILMMRDGPGAV